MRPDETTRARLRLEIRGAVQGVGFRPFLFRLAQDCALDGWVANDTRGVVLEVEGPRAALQRFASRIPRERPAPSSIEELDVTWLPPVGQRGFRIESSDAAGVPTAQVLPDIATCDACRGEFCDAADRRAGYPFTNCTHCGPRFTIVHSLPYDRPNTTMRKFAMCERCQAEYDDPTDRRFHAQPNACAECGPALALWDGTGRPRSHGAEALQQAAQALADGKIVAVKGLGGFHLMVDARNDPAVRRLRENKPRRDKPLALMVRDLQQARELCVFDDRAADVLTSAESPILLVPRRPHAAIATGVAPGNPHLGLMLPYTPLHHLLLATLDFPLVATSGNLSEEPICTDEQEARDRLGRVAELYLVHDRPIARHVDDSIVTLMRGAPRILRRARGYAPRPVLLPQEVPTLLAVGAHLKNTIALSVGRRVFISQHIGDMETPQAIAAFEQVIADFLELYKAEPVAVVHDLHPDYVSTRWARSAVEREDGVLGGLPLVAVQHHHAHLAACLADNGVDGPALGVSWDGTGYGTDGTVWGGEFLLGTAAGFERVAQLRSLRLPGGEAAIREPRRAALALLWELEGARALEREELEPVRTFRPEERRLLGSMLERNVNTPLSTSVGRLFDGVAALLGLHQHASFEGQAAMALEHVADPRVQDGYPLELVEAQGSHPAVLDWRPLIAAVLEEQRRGVPVATIAARFHEALIDGMVRVALLVGQHRVALSGGCFQNRRLVERAAARLESCGFEVLLHRQIPPNDGGISLGQIAVAAARRAAGI